MVKSQQYNTRTMYSAQDVNGLGFVEKHMRYMSQFPNLDCLQYVSNLKMMTKRTD
ncbi:hypothetical protein RAAC3_TM7C00001G0702 [Candidatus Saccharibacteria bacterium RAAC3_TM7_1]|nr:hypothetical protein RAAC3_TM7C00001G0702 [Candidatus Saccharibacteria bacterium RAAC3_TM7_1]